MAIYIFKPDRYLLRRQIKQYSHHIKGYTIDIGAGGFSRYEDLFICDKYIKMDIFKGENIDVVGSADKIPFNNDSFDSIISTQVLEHLKYPEKSIQEMNRVLKKGGICLLTAPQFNELHSEPHDYFRYTKYGLIELFERNNFDVVEYSQIGGYNVVVAQIKIRYLLDRFNLHRHKILGKIANYLFKIYGHFQIWLDRRDTSMANRKHTIGWVFVAKKK